MSEPGASLCTARRSSGAGRAFAAPPSGAESLGENLQFFASAAAASAALQSPARRARGLAQPPGPNEQEKGNERGQLVAGARAAARHHSATCGALCTVPGSPMALARAHAREAKLQHQQLELLLAAGRSLEGIPSAAGSQKATGSGPGIGG